ncbi:MAG: hypothetical protein NUW37_18475 [Planctomycetes bacterium]|nr:hypothetical protein [Planctomycetota bacterium]
MTNIKFSLIATLLVFAFAASAFSQGIPSDGESSFGHRYGRPTWRLAAPKPVMMDEDAQGMTGFGAPSDYLARDQFKRIDHLALAPFEVTHTKGIDSLTLVPEFESVVTVKKQRYQFRLGTEFAFEDEEVQFDGFKADFDNMVAKSYARMRYGMLDYFEMRLSVFAISRPSGADTILENKFKQPQTELTEKVWFAPSEMRLSFKYWFLSYGTKGSGLALITTAQRQLGNPRKYTAAGTWGASATLNGTMQYGWGALHAMGGYSFASDIRIANMDYDAKPIFVYGFGMAVPWSRRTPTVVFPLQFEGFSRAYRRLAEDQEHALTVTSGVRFVGSSYTVDLGVSAGLTESAPKVVGVLSFSYLF